MPINSFKQDEKTVSVNGYKTLLRLFSYLLNYKKQIIIVTLIMLFCVGVSLLNPIFFESAIDDYISKSDIPGLLKLLGIASVLNIACIFLIRYRMLVMADVCNDLLQKIRQNLYIHIQGLDFTFFDNRPTGKILARVIGDINSLKDVLTNSVTTLIPDLLTVIAVLVIMFTKNYKLAAASLISLPFMMGALWFIQVRSHKRWQVNKNKTSNLTAFIHEDFSGIKIIQSFSAEKETDETFHRLVKEQRASFLKAVRLNDAFYGVVDLSWGVGTCVLYYFAIKVLGIETVSVGTLLAFGTYIGMFWQPIMNLSNYYNQLITNISGAERIFEILDTESKIQDAPNAIALPPIQGSVRFSDVSFSYNGEGNVLNHVSFSVKPGESIALVGSTGAGKTTIVNLLSRFYEATDGMIYIDDYAIKDVTLDSLRTQMGVMTQDNFLFSGTVSDNIRYGRLDATQEEIEAAAKAVNAHEFIMRMDKGYDTELGERGGSLSVGQKQLLAFARTMLSQPKILILDEATSSIDTQTELLVQKGIETLLQGRTSFIIAHRLSTIQKADRIFVIEDGQILEEGNSEQLLAKRGIYYDLYMAQFKGL